MDLHYSQTQIRGWKAPPCFTTLWIYTILKLATQGAQLSPSFTTLWIYTILKPKIPLSFIYGRFTTLWIYTILKPSVFLFCFLLGFTTLWIYTILKPGRHTALAMPVSLPYGFTLFSNNAAITEAINEFHYLMDLHYSQTGAIRILATLSCFTTLWIYTILKRGRAPAYPVHRFTTLWIYTILKPQISCAHYTAQGKSTRSSTIVLWRNGIVKGAQIPIQHIEFGAHIYAHRCLAL